MLWKYWWFENIDSHGFRKNGDRGSFENFRQALQAAKRDDNWNSNVQNGGVRRTSATGTQINKAKAFAGARDRTCGSVIHTRKLEQSENTNVLIRIEPWWNSLSFVVDVVGPHPRPVTPKSGNALNAGVHCLGCRTCQHSEFDGSRGLSYHSGFARTRSNLPHFEMFNCGFRALGPGCRNTEVVDLFHCPFFIVAIGPRWSFLVSKNLCIFVFFETIRFEQDVKFRKAQ